HRAPPRATPFPSTTRFRSGRPCTVLNDADAAGLAEARFGAARERRGLVIVVTIGTGIGSAVLYDGVLVPNSELGHLQVNGKVAEDRTSTRLNSSHQITSSA